jgi:UDP-2,4-diacetamido-2,4,6-trideoxy-beta-L-altropyranose hydrolase
LIQVAFRVDASLDIGFGHVMRCLALAQALEQRGARCVFVCCAVPGHLGELIASRGHEIRLMPRTDHEWAGDRADYGQWLSTSVAGDAVEFISLLPEHCDTVVVDHYALGSEWEQLVKPACRQLVALDDLCRSHAVDVVIDQTLARKANAYSSATIGRCLVGSDYALLHPDFIGRREQRRVQTGSWGNAPDGQHRLLVTLGGVDQVNATLHVVEALIANPVDWLQSIDVVLPESAPHYAEVVARLQCEDAAGMRIELHSFVDNFAELMVSATLAIGAPGATTWERSALGIPSVLIPIADNQRDIANAMVRADAAIALQIADVENDLLSALQKLAQNWRDYACASAAVCDALGARRAALQLIPLRNGGDPVGLRPGQSQDAELLWAWHTHWLDLGNESLHQQSVQKLEHDLWFDRVRRDPDQDLLFLTHCQEDAGVIRLKRCSDSADYMVSILLAEPTNSMHLERVSLGLTLLAEIYASSGLRVDLTPDSDLNVGSLNPLGYVQVSPQQLYHEPGPL